jgi:hypothetical protein
VLAQADGALAGCASTLASAPGLHLRLLRQVSGACGSSAAGPRADRAARRHQWDTVPTLSVTHVI